MTLPVQSVSEPAVDPSLEPASRFPGYFEDASHFCGTADFITFPETEEQTAHLLREAYRQKEPVTISGGGTGLTGARVPQGGILLSTERMNRILQIEWDETRKTGYAVVQPGVSLKALEDALGSRGFFYPPDPGEQKAFLGGNVATNASGPRSFQYGPTRRWIRRLRVVLPQGNLVELRRGEQKAQAGRLEFAFPGQRMVRVLLPTYPMPSCKNAAGYFTTPGMDAVDLFIGAEGTLGVVTEIEVEILRKPEAVLSGILFFDDEWDCFAFAQEARRMKARVLEFFDSRSLAFLARKHPDVPIGAGSALYFQRECTAAEYDRLLEDWELRSEEFNARPSDCWFGRNEQDFRLFRRFRYDLPVSVNEQAARNGFRKIGTDLAAPAPYTKGMLSYYLTELPKQPVEFLFWGHLGDNHLHVNFLPKSSEEFEQAMSTYAEMARQFIQWGGTVSAEHGIGKMRIPYLEMMVGRKGLLEMARVKKALDPEGLLNRGNIFPTELLNEV